MVLYKGISIKYTVNQQDKQTDKTDCIMKKHRYKRQKKKNNMIELMSNTLIISVDGNGLNSPIERKG